jgi:heparan sulfate N-deacetylase/N-sulfotransferase NDST2
VFVGKNRFQTSDVQALIESQKKLSQMIPGFRYNLGFSGGKTDDQSFIALQTLIPQLAGYFHSGTEAQNLGDDAILEHKDLFWWFPHMYKHRQPHLFDNVTDLIKDMLMNKEFAVRRNIPVDNRYSIAPHHSGVYPVHEQLYEAWRKVWDIQVTEKRVSNSERFLYILSMQVTSTEEYPHLRPARLRRGFEHEGIRVLPRQTCGLFTKNLFYSEYPGGPQALENSINGGELFQTILFNPISIFMTHMPNYIHDRLAPYTFESVVNKLKCWTNLELVSKQPEKLAEIYFTMFPDELEPIWGVSRSLCEISVVQT